jgi:hypothetical protein
MANNRIPALVEGRSGGRSAAPGLPGARQAHPPHPAPGCTPAALGAEVRDEQTRRFQLATWLLERHNRLGAQRAHSALMLMLGNVVLLPLVVLMSFLSLGNNLGWWLLFVAACLTLVCILVSTLFALLAGASLPAGGGSAAPEAGLFFQSGKMPMLSAAQFGERFHRATRQQMMALLLFALMVLVVLVKLVW